MTLRSNKKKKKPVQNFQKFEKKSCKVINLRVFLASGCSSGPRNGGGGYRGLMGDEATVGWVGRW